MNSKIAVAVGLAAVMAAVLAPISTLAPAFAAEVAVDITPGSSTKTTDAFSPNPVNVNVGDKVTWTNKDSTPHTVTSGTGGSSGTPDGKFDSSPGFNPLIPPQGKFSFTFSEAGEFPYYCGLHPNMVGKVVVAGTGNGNGDGEPEPTPFSVTASLDDNDYVITGTGNATATAATINSGQSVEVEFDGAGSVELTLPTDMIRDITTVMVGTETIEPEVVNSNATHTTISFEVPEGETSVQIMGGFVVPEFPVIATILAATIGGIIGYTRLARSGTGFFGRA